MKEEYSIPEMEITLFGKSRVITDSNNPNTGNWVPDGSNPGYEGETDGW